LKMTRDELKSLVRDLYFYFRLKTPADREQIDTWLKDLEFIESKALAFILTELKDLDNVPRNLPKQIKTIYALYRRQNPATAFIKYDAYDDMRYPIAKLQAAVEMFLESGEDAFALYCQSHYMPSQDIERCLNKVNMIQERLKSENCLKLEDAVPMTNTLPWGEL
jgi:hypothetical protein